MKESQNRLDNFQKVNKKSKQIVHANMTIEIEIGLNFHEFKDRANRNSREAE